MRKYFLELFAIGLVDSEGRINTEHMTSDALMTSMKTMEELTKMKMDRLVLETTMEMILCMFESCDTEEFTEILGDRKSTRLNSSHWNKSRMPSSA